MKLFLIWFEDLHFIFKYMTYFTISYNDFFSWTVFHDSNFVLFSKLNVFKEDIKIIISINRKNTN